MKRLGRIAIPAAAFCLASGLAATTSQELAEQQVLEALRRGQTIPAQAENLIALAWPEDETYDRVVAARARREIVGFGVHGMQPLRAELTRLPAAHQADAVRALIEMRANVTGAAPPDYVPALEDVLWSGAREAKRVAIGELGRYQSPHAVLPIIDSVLDDPDLMPDGVRALGAIGSDRARFFLERVLHEEAPALREETAPALARIGGKALEPLREALRSPIREIRVTAVRALLPVAGEDDLSALYEYLTRHPDDDPPTTAAVRVATEEIERLLEARRAADAATPPEDF